MVGGEYMGMRNFLIVFTVLVLTMIMVAGCAGEAKEVRTYTGQEQVINISARGKFVIDLGEENPGNLWWPRYDDTMLELVDSEYEGIPMETNPAGESAYIGDYLQLRAVIQRFTFKALGKTGETEINMIRTGLWQGESGEELGRVTFKLNIG